MEILFSIVTLLAACLLLYKGADWLVNSSVLTARALGISKLFIGITIVAFGTSLPELLVSSLAAFQGLGGLCIGNIVGSCIFNLMIVLGLAAIIHPFTLQPREILKGLLLLILCNIILTLLLLDSEISGMDGIILLAGFLIYIAWLLILERRKLGEKPRGKRPALRLKNVLVMILGLIALAAGAELLVSSATFLARQVGISELVIGISVVALGTSLPEVATSLVANANKHEEISFANVIGSNIANILFIIGFVAVINSIRIDINAITPDLVALHAATVMPLLMFLMFRKLGKINGGLMVLLYLGYMVYLYLR